MAEDTQPRQRESSSAPPWRRRLVLALLVAVGASVIARAAFRETRAPQRTETTRATDGTGGAGPSDLTPSTGLLPGDTPTRRTPDGGTGAAEPAPEPTAAERILPFVTEGGIAMLLGLMLGMATRAIAKIFVVLLVLGFIGLQFLAHKGIVNVDWQAMTDWMRDVVLNVSSSETFGEIVKHKLPSAGSFGLGYLLGLKKG